MPPDTPYTHLTSSNVQINHVALIIERLLKWLCLPLEKRIGQLGMHEERCNVGRVTAGRSQIRQKEAKQNNNKRIEAKQKNKKSSA